MKFSELCCAKCGDKDHALFRQNEKGVDAVWMCAKCGTAPIDPGVREITDIVEGKPITAFFCAPKCEHTYDKGLCDVTLDENNRVCGSTAVCDKCGRTAMSISMWEGP